MLRVLAYVPMVLIGLSILFTAVPLSTDRETLEAICAALDCQPGDILEYVPDE